jgi:hypothetical protein
MVTVLFAVMVAGALYDPATEIVPELGLIDQMYRLLPAFWTENDCVCEGFNVTLAGATDCPTSEEAATEKRIDVNKSVYLIRMKISVCNPLIGMI